MNDIIVIDNAISASYQNAVQQLLFSNTFPWHFLSDVSFSESHYQEVLQKDPTAEIQRKPGFSSIIYDAYNQRGSANHLLAPILYDSCKDYCSIKSLTAIRTFLLTPTFSDNEIIHIPHVDKYEPHMVGLYYVNDSDSETIIFEKEFDYFNGDPRIHDPVESMPILKRIMPKKGRFVLFNGKYYHSATQPKNHARAVVNFNFMTF